MTHQITIIPTIIKPKSIQNPQMDQNIEQNNETFRTHLLSSLFDHLNKNQPKPTSNHPNNNNPICSHPVFRDNICTTCNLRNNGEIPIIPFTYISPNLTLTRPETQRLRNANSRAILARRKLHLVVDLDHTLVHTRVNWKLTPHDKKFLGKKTRFGVDYNEPDQSGSLYKMAGGWTKLRPFVRTFIKEASEMFEMWVFTLGCRACGWAAVKVLDPDGSGFGRWRVITREDLVGIDKHSKTLDMVLGDEKMVVVVDDNPRVWDGHEGNVIDIKPYNFFSYDSPYEDKERDASPPSKSWSQLGGDESEENGELAKMLRMLREVHERFYHDFESEGMEEELERRDVREVIKRVIKGQKGLKKKQGCKGKKKNKKG